MKTFFDIFRLRFVLSFLVVESHIDVYIYLCNEDCKTLKNQSSYGVKSQTVPMHALIYVCMCIYTWVYMYEMGTACGVLPCRDFSCR
jgi:hypothetical protein